MEPMGPTLGVGKFLGWLLTSLPWLIPSLALAWAAYTFRVNRYAALYANFDALYQSVLQLGVTNGAFRNPAKTVNPEKSFVGDQKSAYEAYAYMVFNVCETIADGLDLYPYRSLRKKFLDLLGRALGVIARPKSLRETWLPALRAERQLHGAWLAQQEPDFRFKRKFLKFMEGLHPEGPTR